ncbi:hypothetical protein MYX78_00235 [Acidobacteria bacterium AH-259-G07]|nr:hypothetical protein [Acidobacteria bacterium AH-259-G07]
MRRRRILMLKQVFVGVLAFLVLVVVLVLPAILVNAGVVEWIELVAVGVLVLLTHLVLLWRKNVDFLSEMLVSLERIAVSMDAILDDKREAWDYTRGAFDGSVARLERNIISELKPLKTEISNILNELVKSKTLLTHLERASVPAHEAKMPQGEDRSKAILDEDTRSPFVFPVSADEFISATESKAIVAKDDLSGILVRDMEGKGQFLIIPNATGGILIPRLAHFNRKSDFYTHYEKYYYCSNPSAGAISIVRPATVGQVTGGWKLTEKGQLEIS